MNQLVPGAQPHCVFCQIIAGNEPAVVRYQDDLAIVFDNVLTWAPVMLLVVPKVHLSQEELWNDVTHYAQLANRMGHEHCPRGFRILSNFGPHGMQSQDHGHLHILGGRHLGPYVAW